MCKFHCLQILWQPMSHYFNEVFIKAPESSLSLRNNYQKETITLKKIDKSNFSEKLLLLSLIWLYFYNVINITISWLILLSLFLLSFIPLFFMLNTLPFPLISREHNENNAFLLLLCYPCHMQSINLWFSW